MRFRANTFGWYYEFCPTCNKTNQTPGSQFQRNCFNNSSTHITKYKIEIEVEHEPNTVNFVFWDKECIPYVGMSSHALRQIMKKTNKDHPSIYTEHLDHLLKKFSFRVKYQPYYKRASVVRLTQDPEGFLTIPNNDESAKGKAILCLEDNNIVNTSQASLTIPNEDECTKAKAIIHNEEYNAMNKDKQVTNSKATPSAVRIPLSEISVASISHINNGTTEHSQPSRSKNALHNPPKVLDINKMGTNLHSSFSTIATKPGI
ncbi:unnamed protein product [Vicia faba]|uniref:Replication protein n=1 Tax=Vicia faba TaxID=3906 RepID=A0AAV0YK53_VICFA|nr:unnamed protein product [Vicia faba]